MKVTSRAVEQGTKGRPAEDERPPVDWRSGQALRVTLPEMRSRASGWASLLVVVGLLAAIVGCTPSGSSTSPSPSASPAVETASPSPAATTEATPGPTANLPPLQDIVDAGATAYGLAPAPDFAILANGFLYVGGVGPEADRIAKVDDQGATVTELEISGGTCGAFEVGFNAVWSMTCSGPGLARIDLASDSVTSIEIGAIADSESSVGAGQDAVWAVLFGDPRTLVRVDPATNAVAASYPIEGQPTAVRVGFGAVWITDPAANVVYRFDPSAGAVVGTIEVGARPQFLAVGAGAVWTMNQADGTVTRIDPGTNGIAATIQLGEGIQGGDITVGGGYVWLRGSDTLLFKIDPATNQVVARYGPSSGSGSVAADDRAVWVTAHDTRTIWRLPLP